MSRHTLHILGIPGSLRRRSYNRGLIRAAAELAPPGIAVETSDLIGIPLYNGDLEDEGIPEPVRQLAERIRGSAAVLIATPEYNYGIPGVLKNAIDWVSRPWAAGALKHKPIALMGASGGQFGTVRAQLALRQVFINTESFVMPRPELMIPRAQTVFDAHGNLVDESLRDRVRALVGALAEWTERVRQS